MIISVNALYVDMLCEKPAMVDIGIMNSGHKGTAIALRIGTRVNASANKYIVPMPAHSPDSALNILVKNKMKLRL